MTKKRRIAIPLTFGTRQRDGVILLTEIGPSVLWTMKAKMGEVCENAHSLKNGSLVIRQENVFEIVKACIIADRREAQDELRQLQKKFEYLHKQCACPDCGCALPEEAEAKECGCDSPICDMDSDITLADAYDTLHKMLYPENPSMSE